MTNSAKGTAMVMGVASGIGVIYADRLARRGYDLVLAARNRERLNDLAKRLTEETGRTVKVVADVLIVQRGRNATRREAQTSGRKVLRGAPTSMPSTPPMVTILSR